MYAALKLGVKDFTKDTTLPQGFSEEDLHFLGQEAKRFQINFPETVDKVRRNIYWSEQLNEMRSL